MISSNKSNIHSEYDPNKKIKEEPDTISEPSTSNSSIIPNLIKTVKTEFNYPTLTRTRLPSFRLPRDLTLGGNVKFEKPKKVYIPNLNAQRNKNRKDQNTANKNESNSRVNKGRNHDKGRTHSNKGTGKNNLFQSTGIFSEGFVDISSKRHSGGINNIFRDKNCISGKETVLVLERPKLSIPQKINKVEEAEKLRELLRDDFVDNEEDLNFENAPIGLPMVNKDNIFKIDDSRKVSISKYDNSNFKSGEVKTGNRIQFIKSNRQINEAQVSIGVAQVMESKSSTFILMQLPDCLPGLQTDDKQNDPRLKRVPDSSTQNETDKMNKFCTLNNLKEGMLGKLQILRSGKTRLVLGENDLLIDVGSNLSFRQDLIATKINSDKQSGDLVNLGPVNTTLVCSPNWENMLKNL